MPFLKAAPQRLSATEAQPRVVLGERSLNQGHDSTKELRQKPVSRRVNFALEETHFSTLEEHEPPKTLAPALTRSQATEAHKVTLQQSVPSSAQQAHTQRQLPAQPRVFVQPPAAVTETAGRGAATLRSPRSVTVMVAPMPTEPSAESRAPSTASVRASVVSRRAGPFVVSSGRTAVPFASSMEYSAGTRPTVQYLMEQQERTGPLFTYYTALHRRAHVPPGLPATYQPVQTCTRPRAPSPASTAAVN